MVSHGYKDSIHERPFGVAGGWGACMVGGVWQGGHVWQGMHACWGVFVAREQIDRLRLRAVIYLFPFTKRTNTRIS